MPAQTLQTEGIVLGKRPPAEAFQTLTIFTAESGPLFVLQRVTRKSAASTSPLDLFDEAALVLESSNQGQTWFLREARVLSRPAGIGRTYDTLRFASRLAALVARNAGDATSRETVMALLRTAFQAFATSDRPDVTYFKSLYLFARDEGYPLKQQWFPTLPQADRADVSALLNRPLGEQTASQPAVARLQARLEEFLAGHTEIVIP